VRLLIPFVLITLPLLALVAACAVLFDTLPGLRGGTGALVWFAVWLGGMMLAQSSGGYDLLSMGRISESMRTAIEASGASGDAAEAVQFGVGLTASDKELVTFDWAGLGPGDLGNGLLANTVLLFAAAALLATAATLWFRRFDTAAASGGAAALLAGAAGTAGASDTGITSAAPGEFSDQQARRGASFELDPARMTPVRYGASFASAATGELRVLLQGIRVWWWAGLAAIAVISALVELDNLVVPMLALAMLWPVFIWSRMGNHADAGNVDDLLAACPGGPRA